MKFNKIKFDGERMHLAWTDTPKDGTTEKHEYDSGDAPMPSFVKALKALKGIASTILEIGQPWAEGATARSIAIDYRSGENQRGLVISLIRPVEHANGPANISTPRIVENTEEGGPALIDEAMRAVDKLCKEAIRYYNGHREQSDMFTEEAAEG